MMALWLTSDIYIYICTITLLHIHLQHQHITTSAADVPPYPKVLGLHHIPGTSLPADRGLCREPSHECFMLFPDVGNCCMVPMASGVVLMTFPCFSNFQSLRTTRNSWFAKKMAIDVCDFGAYDGQETQELEDSRRQGGTWGIPVGI